MRFFILTSLFLFPLVTSAEMRITSIEGVQTLPEGTTLSLPCPRDTKYKSCLKALSQSLIVDGKPRMYTYVMVNPKKISKEKMLKLFEKKETQWKSYDFDRKSRRLEEKPDNLFTKLLGINKAYRKVHINAKTDEVIVNGFKGRLLAVDSAQVAFLKRPISYILPTSVEALNNKMSGSKEDKCFNKLKTKLEGQSPCVNCEGQRTQASIQKQSQRKNLKVLENKREGNHFCVGHGYPVCTEDITDTACTGEVLNLENRNFQNAKLQGAHFWSALLKNADLRGADLRGADLRGADLRGADLRGADLRGADLFGAQLQGAILTGTNFQEANLEKANFDRSRLREVNLEKANMEGVSFKEAHLEKVNLANTNMFRADFHKTKFKDTNLTNADLFEADFRETELKHTDFTKANMSNSNFSEATLIDVNFTESNLRQVHFNKMTQLSRANFNKASMEYGHFEGVQFQGMNLKDIRALSSNFNGANFDGADLSGAMFRLTQLKNVSVVGTKLNNVKLAGAKLDGVDLSKANWNTINWNGVHLSEKQKEVIQKKLESPPESVKPETGPALAIGSDPQPIQWQRRSRRSKR